MMQGVPQPAFYIFKCQQSAPPGMPKPSCVSQNDPESAQLFQHLAQSLMMKGIIGTFQPIQTGCLNRCQQGPVMLVEPEHTMYVESDSSFSTRSFARPNLSKSVFSFFSKRV